MRIHIEIDDNLINSAKRLSNSKTNNEVVNLAFQILIKHLKKQKLLDLYGKVKWQENLNEMRK